MKKILVILFLILFLSYFTYSKWTPGNSLIDSRDGQVYRTVVVLDLRKR